jgi:hypothetical protein
MFGLQLRLFKIIFLGVALYLFFVALFSNPVADYDLWGYLSFGRIIFENNYFPFHDLFSYTPTKSLWVYHEWLTGVLFYIIYMFTGAAGLQLLRYVVVLLTIYLMYLTAEKRGGEPVWRLISVIPATLLISFGYVPVRAQIFTYLFFILTLFILENVKRKSRWSLLWWLVPIQVVWCNLHGGYLSGIGLIFLYALGEGLSKRRTSPFIIIGFIAFLSTLINPYGIHYWLYIFQSVSMPRPEINEWASVLGGFKRGIYHVPIYIFLSMSFLCFMLYVIRRKHDKTDILVMATIFYLGFAHIRHNVFFGLVFGSYLPAILQEHWNTMKEKRYFMTNWSWMPQSFFVALIFSLYIFINPHMSVKGVAPSFLLLSPSPSYPTGAFNWMVNNSFKGNILPQFEWGEILIWFFHPDCRVAMDGRYETVYEESFSKEYFDFLNGTDKGIDFLNKYPHDMILIKANTKADLLLRNNPAWKRAFIDSVCALYLKRK